MAKFAKILSLYDSVRSGSPEESCPIAMEIDLNIFDGRETPFYFYDINLLRKTLREVNKAVDGRPIVVHYAIKANANNRILREISSLGFSADCVSGGEIKLAIENGFESSRIFYAGVGKTDREIREALAAGIGCFNIESIEELEVIGHIASDMGVTADIALRVNPDIDAHTHHYITTGLEENKFGIDRRRLDKAVEVAQSFRSLRLAGLHFHIGSQITTLEPFVILCERVNDIMDALRSRGIRLDFVDLGGGLGIDYDDPDSNPVADFRGWFDTIMKHIRLEPGQKVHVEPGRAIVGQCGSLISRVLYVKEGIDRRFVILDAGMTELIRPALYQAHHKIENLSAATRSGDLQKYDVVGPVCESAVTFGDDELLPPTRRGDIVALRSAGAYGEAMSSHYNCRYISDPVYGE